VILADTSAWVEFLRRTGSPTNAALRAALVNEEILVVDPVRLEVLAGATSAAHRRRLGALLDTNDSEPLVPVDDWQSAADLYLSCRRAGTTIRSLIDCLIAAVAIRLDVPVLHRDIDFTHLARLTTVQIAPGSLRSA
jgi:predicted nucleic acid-binding protein